MNPALRQMRAVPLRPANEVTFMSTALAMVAGLGITVCLPYAEPYVEAHAWSIPAASGSAEAPI
jgi:hypothetical protein